MPHDRILRTELDRRLDSTANAPDTFEGVVQDLIAEYGARHLDLDDPQAWRKPVPFRRGGRPVAFIKQFKLDVARIEPLTRKAEARLARAIEFARTRLAMVTEASGLTPEERDERIAHPTRGWCFETAREVIDASDLPHELARRWVELHALRSELVERSLFLVPLNVERYARTGASRVDLIQEGNIALYRAVDGFDWRRGLLFRTYAVHWLNQAFRDHLYNFSNVVRLPIYVQKAIHKAGKGRNDDLPGTASELAEESGLSVPAARAARGILRGSLSLEHEDKSGARLVDQIEDRGTAFGEQRREESELCSQLERAFERLTARERRVLGRRFGLGDREEATLAEVAEELDLSIERVRQIQVSALEKLAAPRVRRQFEAFLT